MKRTQHDLVVLSLASHGEWRKAYELEKVYVDKEMIGSEADTRLYELFDKNVTDEAFKSTTRKIDGDTYTIETKKDGNRRVYRAYITNRRPRYKVEYDYKTGRAVQVPC